MVAAKGTVVFHVTGHAGVPVGARAVTMNVTVTQAQATGFVTVWPCDEPLPVASEPQLRGRAARSRTS